MRWLRIASILLLGTMGCRLAVAADAGNGWVFVDLQRTGWPDALSSQARIDTASRAEVLMFAKVLLASETLDAGALQRQLDVPHVRLKPIRQVREGLWERLLGIYRNASQDCGEQLFCARVRSVADLRQLAAAFTGDISPAHAQWASKSQGMHEQELNAQLRVAVLRP